LLYLIFSSHYKSRVMSTCQHDTIPSSSGISMDQKGEKERNTGILHLFCGTTCPFFYVCSVAHIVSFGVLRFKRERKKRVRLSQIDSHHAKWRNSVDWNFLLDWGNSVCCSLRIASGFMIFYLFFYFFFRFPFGNNLWFHSIIDPYDT
jgi:hypothetical protein